LNRLASELHDSWIDLPSPATFVESEAVQLTGTLEFGDVRCLRAWGPLARVVETKPRIEITVENVLAVSLEDSAEIGSLNIAGIHFDESAGQIRIDGAIPASVILTVSSLGVRVHVTDEIVERRERWRLRARVRER